jgi:hypothetical protein
MCVRLRRRTPPPPRQGLTAEKLAVKSNPVRLLLDIFSRSRHQLIGYPRPELQGEQKQTEPDKAEESQVPN